MATSKVGKPTRHRKKMNARNIPAVVRRKPDTIAHNLSRSLIERMLEGQIDHNDLQALQGGTTDEYYHLTAANHAALIDLHAETVQVGEIDTATYDDVQDVINNLLTAGVVSGGTITENVALNGTIDIAAAKGYLKTTASEIGSLVAYDLDAVSGMSVSTGLNYIYVDYNSGTPQFAAETTLGNINHYSETIIGNVYKSAEGHLYIINGGYLTPDTFGKTHWYLNGVFGGNRASGLITSESTLDRGLVITAGVFWRGLTKVTVTSTDTNLNHAITGVVIGTKTFTISGDHVSDFYHGRCIYISGSTGNDGAYHVQTATLNGADTDLVVEESISDGTVDGDIHYQTFMHWYYTTDLGWTAYAHALIQLPNTTYNDITEASGGTPLPTLNNNQYGIHWVYLVNNSTVHVLYGQDSYTLAEAQDATTPANIPTLLSSTGIIVAKVIIKKSATNFTSVTTPFATRFTAGTVDEHNDLGSLQGGTADEYYHLTSAQHEDNAELTSPAFTGTPTAPTAAADDSSTQIATTAHVTNKIANLNLFTYKGAITNADTNPNYPAGDAGDIWVFTTNAGKIGGASGPDVEIGDTALCITDSTASGDHATVGSNWILGQANLNPDLYALLSGAAFTGDVSITGGSLNMTGTDTHFLPPSLTTAEKNALSPATGWLVFDETLNELQIYANGTWNSIGGGGGQLTVNQNSHGFVVGEPIYCSGVNIYTSAQADTEAKAEIVGLVAVVIDTNNFILQQNGALTLTTGEWDIITGGSGGLDAGDTYFLDPDTAGQIIDEDDIDGDTFDDGEVQRPIVLGLSTTVGMILPYRGNVIGDSYARGTSFVVGDLSSGVLTFQHDLDTKYPIIVVYDADGKPVVPQEIEPTSGSETTSSDITFSSAMQTEMDTDTWYVKAIGTGVAIVDNLSDSDPEDIGATASAGTSEDRSRADHVHCTQLKQYLGDGTDFSITATGWANSRSVAIPYQTSDGTWRLIFNFSGSVTATTSATLTIGGVTFKDGQDQAVAAYGTTDWACGRVVTNTSTIIRTSGASTANVRLSGDVELESKPTWAD